VIGGQLAVGSPFVSDIAATPQDRAPARGGKRKVLLGVGALGVVFGDIGTSPLYAFQEIFSGAHSIPALEGRVMGAASMVFWTLTLIVSVKYVLIVMRADNKGEGGIMALASLAVGALGRMSKRRKVIIMGLGILGAALFYGDGMITPAVSVLSAVEGLELVAPGLDSWVVPIAVVILVGLFMIQRHGTGKMGAAFGPVMFVWFVCIAILGAASVIQTPGVIDAINPSHAVSFFVGEPMLAFLALGSVVLCVTGAEALYADMGQFGRGPIRFSWFAIAVPALYLNYFGQAALVLRDPSAVSNPFYLLVPTSLQLPMVILATVATVIASQAVISGAFSMTKQAIQLDYLPRLLVRHTSSQEKGQVYVPAVNWTLMVAVVFLVVLFQDSSNLASAYGIAVTGTFVITTCLITDVALHKWKVRPLIVWPVFTLFFIIDMAFFTANLTKFFHGGWYPLLSAAIIFSILMTWRRGRSLMLHSLAALGPSLKSFATQIRKAGVKRTPGSMVYLSVEDDIAPFALVQHARLLDAVSEQVVILRFESLDTPRVSEDQRVTVINDIPGFSRVTARFGFMERTNVNTAMERAVAQGLPIDPNRCTYVVHQVSIEPSKQAPMWLRRQYLFAFMQRSAQNPMIYMHLPTDRVLGVWTVVKLKK
jgi:KUP system potassium uptake protein